MVKIRYYWIDWMKLIGMLLIIWGHLFPKYSSDIIYSFNVPLFFCISGFLGGGKNRTLKLKPLVVPYLVVCATYLLLDIPWQYKAGDLSCLNYIKSVGYMLAGFQTTPHGVSASAMWFVYTLALCKAVHYISGKTIYRLFILVLFLVFTVVTQEYHLFWSFQNLFICYPFYYIGALLFEHCQSQIQMIKAFAQTKKFLCICLVCTMVLLLSLIAPYNGFVKMYQCGYGHSFLLFFILSAIGVGAVFLFAMVLESIRPSFLRIISQGSIVILAYHYLGIRCFNSVCKVMNEDMMHSDWLTFCFSLSLLIVHIPIIKFVSRNIPIIVTIQR